jgi:penicillin amidase
VLLRLLLRGALGVLAAIVVAIVSYAVYVAAGWHAEAHLDGTLSGLPVKSQVVVLRDARGVPHVRAQSMHDLMVAQGYLEASDRLFQIDLVRHLVYGRLAEWFGKNLLDADMRARSFDVQHVIATEYAHLSSQERDNLVAFSDGINAAMHREPLPVEYRLLLLWPQAWTPEDTLAVGFSTVLVLTDPWEDVIERERVFDAMGQNGTDGLYSITDPKYDVPITDGPPAPVPTLPALRVYTRPPARSPRGSNEWAVGASRSTDRHALLANDPHLDITMPGIWYLIDLQAPGFHVAGATLAGTSGVILGHNEHIAWGATNGNVISESVYVSGYREQERDETFHVRFAAPVDHAYNQDMHGFSVFGDDGYSVDWPAVADPVSPEQTFERLNVAANVDDALAALRAYPGPTQNFVVADTNGRATYHLAGAIPNDPLWGLRTHPPADPHYPAIPFDQLPNVAPSRDAVVFTANNRMYGRDYHYRLSAWFAPPYRAARIAQLLRARKQYDVGYFSQMQADTLSLPEQELVQMTLAAAQHEHAQKDPQLGPLLDQLAHWDGRFTPDSNAASLAFALRQAAVNDFIQQHFASYAAEAYRSSSDVIVVLMRALRERPKGYFPFDNVDDFLLTALREAAPQANQPWKTAGAIPVRHPFAFLGMPWFNGVPLRGDGDAYTVHAQLPFAGQSFRAVWDVGNWDAGGIVIPSGESGRPGSAHHDDASAAWESQTPVSLPFSTQAVDAAARHRLVLAP